MAPKEKRQNGRSNQLKQHTNLPRSQCNVLQR
jgi:hypothetical protein